MSVTKHSARVYILVDPEQGYEETLHILGVYGSLKAAMMATPRRMRPTWRWTPDRMAEIQHWAGDTLVATWQYKPWQNAWFTEDGRVVA
ncbi:hypothetical protein [Mycobacteroides abscessus]|uniref:hypothetical protein n=1 Tax=Mycobacteroides abscessus TaxID=36809 RepID=UPI0009A7DF7D|nr:hypothetical protein [Mycobacteroides abscessus]SLG32875.1 Uncharacterised protein [Mycobacteroides abscessus subsp. abscessus]